MSVPYRIAIARFHMHQHHYPEAKRYLTQAVTKDVKVQSTPYYYTHYELMNHAKRSHKNVLQMYRYYVALNVETSNYGIAGNNWQELN